MAWTSKRIFKVTDSVSSRISPSVWIYDPTQAPTPPAPTAPTVPPSAIEDIQDQIDDIVDSIENEYYTEFVFDKYDYFISTKPFYFHFEIPLGTVEIISARVSFEVKDYRNASLTHSRYAITGDPTDRPVITFYVSEDKGCKFGSAYGPYECDMRAIDILGDLIGEGIKIIKFETDNDVCVTARVFLKLKIDKDETPEGWVDFKQRPEVRTLAATSITDVSATLNGDIVKTGALHAVNRSTGDIELVNECTKRGFKYGLTKTDTWDTNESGSFVKGTYGLGVTGLTPATDYYFRAYAKNEIGISYGEYMKLTTGTIIRGYSLIVTSPEVLQLFDEDGILSRQISVAGWSYGGCGTCMDYEGNIYVEESSVIKKYDNSLNLLVTRNIESGNNWVEGINCGNDGYLYTLEGRASGYAIARRSRTGLTIIEDVVTLVSNYGGGFCLDSDGNFYVYNFTDDKIEKWNSAGTKVASLSVGTISEYAGFGICGSNLYIGDTSSKIYYMPLDLSGYTEWSPGSAICYAITVADEHLILSGWDGDGDGATSKYDSGRNLIWTKKLADITDYAYKAGGYNF